MARSKPSQKTNKGAATAAAVAPAKKAAAPSADGSKTDSFRQDIKDLGGDDEDWKMLQGIDDSGDEGEEASAALTGVDDGVSEAKLSKELASFLKGLDFKATAAPVDESDDEEDAGDASDDAEESDEGEMPLDVPMKVKEPVAAPAAAEAEAAGPSLKEKRDKLAEATKAAKEKAAAAPVAPVKGKKGEVIFPPIPQWYFHAVPELAAKPLPTLTAEKLAFLGQRSNALLAAVPSAPSSSLASKSDANFMAQILKSGTQADKLSALILQVQGDPLRNISALESLRAMTGWKEGGAVGRMGGREERISVVRAVADWWNGGGAPNRKLRYLRDQPNLLHPDATDAHLTLWAFEDWLKKYFFSLLQVLETLSHDTLPFVRTQTLTIVFQLLKEKPEQEQNLLRLLVNKLGDTDKNVASRASYHILQLLQSHPAMKSVVVREISSLVLVPPPPKVVAPSKQTKKQKKKGKQQPMAKKTTTFDKAVDDSGNLHARYYGVITLNQTTLTQRDGEVAGKLVEVYFEVFRGILGDGKYAKEELTGAEKVEVKEPEVAEGSDKGKGKEHKGKGAWKGKGKKTDAKEDEVEDSDAKMIAAVLSGVNRALPFAKIEDSVFEKHMDTLFRITHSGTFNISIQALNLIYQVTAAKESVSSRFYRTLYESLLDPRLAASSKQAMYLNLLFKAIKTDVNTARAAAFVKRTMQILGTHQPPFICGAFFLFGELFSSLPGLRRMLSEPEEDDEEEHFVDAPDPDEEPKKVEKKAAAAVAAAAAAAVNLPPAEKKWDTNYDGKKRDPQYAHAEGSCLWEIVPFLHHFHPSVALHASQLLNNEPISTSSDLNLNTLSHFLDRFVYRNAKKPKAKGASIMQPAAASDKSGVVLMMKGSNGADQEVNSAAFWRQKEEDVPADQLFFHKFFSQKLKSENARKNKAAKRKGGNDDDDALSDGTVEGDDDDEVLPRNTAGGEVAEDAEEGDSSDDEEEKAIWKAMQQSMPELEGGNDGMIGDSDGDDQSDEELVGLSDEDDDADDAEEDDDDDDDDDDSDGGINDAEFDSADEEVFDMDEDEDDLIEVDDEDAFVSAFPPEADEEEDAAEEETAGDGKRKRNNAEDRKERKKKRKLPMFGSYEDWQKIIDDGGPEDNI